MVAKSLAEKVCKILLDRKAQDVVSINVSEKGVADYFVIASGRSSTHTTALVEHVEEEMEKDGVFKIRAEGIKEGRWAVLDYGDVIVHVFNDESRLFYHLEKLWDDGKNVTKYTDED